MEVWYSHVVYIVLPFPLTILIILAHPTSVTLSGTCMIDLRRVPSGPSLAESHSPSELLRAPGRCTQGSAGSKLLSW